MTEAPSYAQLDSLHGVVDEKIHNFVTGSNEETVKALMPLWIDNLKKNCKKSWTKNDTIKSKQTWGVGINKAVVGIGSGPSLKKNIEVLKRVYADDIKRKDRDFIFCAPNHQFKPLLKIGIVPDFVFLVDGAHTLFHQLCEDVPETGKSSILIAPPNISHKITKAWKEQGRQTRYYMLNSYRFIEAFRKLTKIKPESISMEGCGNVFNAIWSISMKVFGSNFFIATGNDLSFPASGDKDKQRGGFYADGDYSSNAPKTGSGRDEGSSDQRWMSFKIVTGHDGKLRTESGGVVGTSPSLFKYKSWIEETFLIVTKDLPQYGLQYFNCTEGGILGVMAKDLNNMSSLDNWYMLDAVCPRWHTTTLESAANFFVRSKHGKVGQASQMP